MMKEKLNGAWEWIKDHKKEIAITAATVVGGVVLYKTGVKFKQAMKDTLPLPNPDKFIPEFSEGECTDFARYNDGAVELWLDNMPLSMFGELGEEIYDQIPDMPENPVVWALINIRKGDET